MKRPVRMALWTFGGFAGLLLILTLAALIVLPSSWFREKVRARIVSEIETASGGKSEIGDFNFDWQSMTAEITPFVLHGTEPVSEPPLLRAESIKVGLRIVSAFKRDIDIASLTIDRPRVNVIVDESGVSNFPEPKIKRTSEKDPVEQLLSLAVQNIDIRHGEIRYADRKIPFTVHGERLNAKLSYNFATPSYEGTVAMEQIELDSDKTLPVVASFDSKVTLAKNRLEIHHARLGMTESFVEVSGIVEDFKNIRASLDVNATATLKDLGKPLNLPQPHIGSASFKGNLNYDAASNIQLAGRITGQGLALKQGKAVVQNISLASDVKYASDQLLLTGLRINALGGSFDGIVELKNARDYRANGNLNGFTLGELGSLGGLKRSQYSGSVSGPLQITGSLDDSKSLKAGGKFKISPARRGTPVNGFVEVAYDQRRQSVQLGNSYLVLPSSRLDVKGTLGQQLTIRLESRDLKDLMPAIAMASDKPPAKLPIDFQAGGSALFEGTVTGPLQSPHIAGTATLANFEVQEQKIDRLVAAFDATESGARIDSLALGQNDLRLEGSADLGLVNWQFEDTVPVKANLKLQNAQIGKLLADAGQKLPIDGRANATLTVEGTAAEPKVLARLNVDKPTFYGENFDKLSAEVRYAGSGVEVINGVAELGSSRVLLAGAYEHPPSDFKNGQLRFNVTSSGLSLQDVKNLQKTRPELKGRFDVKLAGNADVRNAELLPRVLNGTIGLRELSFQGKPIGDFSIDAATAGQSLKLAVTGNLRGSKISGDGAFQLTGDYTGAGTIQFSPITFATLQDLAATQTAERLPFDGSVEGNITFSGPAKKPGAMRARLELPSLQIVPTQKTLTPAQVADLTLKSAEPIVLEYDGKTMLAKSLHMVGKDTDIKVTGAINPTEVASSYDLRVNGNLNLASLRSFNTDLVTSGAAVVNASVRGSLKDPQVNGRIELKNASLYFIDLPNGLDQANGVILFDKRRATIEKLTAQTGGGTLTASGFVGFGSTELSYRLQARADRVRVRYPEGVSTTLNANITLSGTSARSLMAGVVTIQRAGFNPRTDVGGLLAASSTPIATPTTPNEYLRGMQLDVRIETIPNLQFQTTLTNDLQAEADLRLRGTAAKPILQGRIVVNQGEIQFFGNKYTINRGEIGFFNPVKIEPVLDMDLETRARGVLVNINFSGTLSKLNVSYRSDPPLQSSEIIALLAMGRAPGSNSSLASSQTVTNTSLLTTGTNSLLGQAVAAPISNRLQRFFGVSRLKIDPQLTGLNAVPQARLTVEQQISRDVTLTYITNLAQANQQLIRLEWDLSRSWSVVAVREENGVFGVDFLFKKRFK